MSEARVERVLSELSVRYDVQEEFLERLRPMLRTIFSPGIAEERRPELLEMAALTCMRDVEIRRNSEAARQAWAEYFDGLREQLRVLAEFVRRHGGDAGQAPREA